MTTSGKIRGKNELSSVLNAEDQISVVEESGKKWTAGKKILKIFEKN